jgi:hypothetical protein
MTTQQALREARKRFGKTAAVRKTPKGAYIGAHGEFVGMLFHPKDKADPRANQYYCRTCSAGDERVYHTPGARQTCYTVGSIGLGIFFVVEGEGESWSRAFAAADAKRQHERDQYAALRAKKASVTT